MHLIQPFSTTVLVSYIILSASSREKRRGGFFYPKAIMQIIDTHQHFWHYDPVRDDWITEEMSVLKRDYLPSDLAPELKRQHISGCISVQADQSEKETEFLLAQAAAHDFIKGVVGWTDLRSPDIERRLSAYTDRDYICGFRHIVQGEADHNFLLREAFCRGIKALGAFGFTYDILVYPHQLPAVLEFVRRFPDQAFVIDHLAKPYIRDGFIDGWAVLIREIGRSENVYCKLSGMVTEADWKNWAYEDFVPYLDVVMEAFGPRRVMYGSDWPVCRVAATYDEMFGVIRRYAGQFSAEDQEALYSGNAMYFYGIQS